MCGIAGIMGEGAARQREALQRMVSAQTHRGPDGEGIWVSPSGSCLLGQRRLAILDLTPAAAQPMTAAGGRYAFVYNGECYNYPELRRADEARGERFVSHGDTEVVLKRLAEKGTAALSEFNAMFALALWDETERTLLLARDRFGQKPLYWTRSGPLLVFASELRALLASGLVERRVDWPGVVGYLAQGAVQEPHTVVAGVTLLPRGCYRLWRADGSSVGGGYWAPPRDKRECPPERLREEFTAAVRRHLISDVPIGLFLSGGVDSSAVAAAAVHGGASAVKSLAVVFPEQPEQSEGDSARRMAEWAGTDHLEIPVTGREMLARLPTALDALDQPSIDGPNTYLVSWAARQAGLKVALSGLGGDELFAGYPSFRDVPWMWRLRRGLGPAGPMLAGNGASPPSFARQSGKLADWLESPPQLTASYLVRRRLFSSRQIRALLPTPEASGWISGLAPERMAAIEQALAGRPLPDAVGWLEMDVYMGQTLLRDSDVMGMAHGLEIRLPFLDAAFAETALTLPAAVRRRRRVPKHYFVAAMGDWLPRANTHRPKIGFGLPFREWMQGELRDEVEAGIRYLAGAGGAVVPGVVAGVWADFLRQPEQVGWSRPWGLFVLGRYLERHRLTV